jgi:hypothetical protein
MPQKATFSQFLFRFLLIAGNTPITFKSVAAQVAENSEHSLQPISVNTRIDFCPIRGKTTDNAKSTIKATKQHHFDSSSMQ